MEITFEIRTKVKLREGEVLRAAVVAALRANTQRRLSGVNDPLLVAVRAAAEAALPQTCSMAARRALRTEIVQRLSPAGLGYIYPTSAG